MRSRIAVIATLAIGVGGIVFFRYSTPTNLEPLRSIDRATYVTSEGKVIGPIDLKPVRDSMADAEWISNSPINKGSYRIRARGFPTIDVSDYNGYFWIKGRRGFFKVDEKNQREFDAHFQQSVRELLNPTGQTGTTEANKSR